MKTSRYIQIDPNLPYKRFYPKLVKKNKGPKSIYVLCTPPGEGNLFEIITCNQLGKKYNNSFILGISKDKTWLVNYTVTLIDQLYNTKNLSYDMLQSE